MNTPINPRDQVISLEALIKGFEDNPTSAVNHLEEQVVKLMQNRDFEPFWKGMQLIQKRLTDINVRLLNRQELDLPLEAVGLTNLICRTVTPNHIDDTFHFRENLQLSLAVNNNDYAEIRRLLIANPISSNQADERRQEIFGSACETSTPSIMNLFIRAGIDVNFTLFGVHCPICQALRVSIRAVPPIRIQQEKLALLLAAGADPNLDSRYDQNPAIPNTPTTKLIFQLMQFSNIKEESAIHAIPLLVDAGMDLDNLFMGVNPIEFALSKNLNKIAKALIFNGTNQITPRSESYAYSTGNQNKLYRWAAIRNNALNQLGPTTLLPQLTTIESLKAFPIDLLRIIDSYRTPTLRAMRELCYVLEASST